MKKSAVAVFFFCFSFVLAAQEFRSPAGAFVMTFSLLADGTPTYRLSYKGSEVIKQSKLGLQLKADSLSLLNGFAVADAKTSSFDESWTPVWGEAKSYRNHYNEMAVTLTQQKADRFIIIRFRLFDDGLGFRYEFPQQKKLGHFIVKEERTQFAMTGDYTAYWISTLR